VRTLFIERRSPWENGYSESFNGRFRDACLNVKCFFSLQDARVKLECWREDYNRYRPHSALSDRTPVEVAGYVDNQGTGAAEGRSPRAGLALVG
jgi:putative transposase